MIRGGAFLATVLLVLAACTSSTDPSGSPLQPGVTPQASEGVLPVEATPAPTPSVPSGTTGPEVDIEPFDPGNFSNPTAINNPWMPLVPGMQWIFEGSATIDAVKQARSVVLTVTDLTKVIGGIRAVAGYELDYTDGILSEAELAFWAQDDDGTVWRLGEYPEVYDLGQIVEAPAWMHGLDDAAAGIAMQANPRMFTPSYSQGWGPEVGWTDRGRVFEVNSETCVPFDCYLGLLVITEFSNDDPDVYQLKYYAKGVGGVRVGWAGAREEEQEVLELVSFVRLNAAEMEVIRAGALAQEARGYDLNDVYAQTPRLERSGN
ncbi:MAG: hypothetical protein AABZ33_08645 [Chloroflexota bacterium]